MTLTDAWPAAIRFGDLVSAVQEVLTDEPRDKPLNTEAAENLATLLLRCYGTGLVELRTSPPRLVVETNSHPQVTGSGSPAGRDRQERDESVAYDC